MWVNFPSCLSPLSSPSETPLMMMTTTKMMLMALPPFLPFHPSFLGATVQHTRGSKMDSEPIHSWPEGEREREREGGRVGSEEGSERAGQSVTHWAQGISLTRHILG